MKAFKRVHNMGLAICIIRQSLRLSINSSSVATENYRMTNYFG